MNRGLLRLLTQTHDDVTLAGLGRAIAGARRVEPMRVWRTFVQSRAPERLAHEDTQRLRIVIRTSSRREPVRHERALSSRQE